MSELLNQVKELVPTYEAASFDILDSDGNIEKTYRGNQLCIEYEYSKLDILPIKN